MSDAEEDFGNGGAVPLEFDGVPLNDVTSAGFLSNFFFNHAQTTHLPDRPGFRVPEQPVGVQHRPKVDKEALAMISPRGMFSWRSPNLEECYQFMQDDVKLYALLEHLLGPNQHVSHLSEWFTFLLCANDAPLDIRLGNHSFDEQMFWCKGYLQEAFASVRQKVCPKSFSTGDIVWNCETCQRDATCVQCQECFELANHDGHNVSYMRVMSTIGGCCDCGDEQAWRPAGFCSNHGRTASAEELPATLRHSAERLFEFLAPWLADACLEACDWVLVDPDTNFVDKALENLIVFYPARISESSTSTRTEAFEPCLRNVTDIDYVEREFERHILDGSLSIDDYISFQFIDVRKPIGYLCARISYVTRALLELCGGSDALVSILSIALTDDDNDITFEERAEQARLRKQERNARVYQGNLDYAWSSILPDLIGADPLLPSYVMESMYQLHMRLLIDPNYKQRFAIAFVESYSKLTYLARESPVYNDGQDRNGVFMLTVQYMNRPQFIDVLVRHLDYVDDLFHEWSDILNECSSEDGNTIDLKHELARNKMTRFAYTDLKHIVKDRATARYLVLERPDRMSTWLSEILGRMQGMDAHKRIPETDPAIEYENLVAQEAAFTLGVRAALLSDGLIRGYARTSLSDDFVYEDDFMHKLLELAAFLTRFFRDGRLKFEASAGIDKLSFWLPLYRFISKSMCASLCIFPDSETLNQQMLEVFPHSECMAMGVAALRTLVGFVEVGLKLWVRNGESVEATARLYHEETRLMLLQDIRTVQFASLLLGSDWAVNSALSAFGLSNSRLVNTCDEQEGDLKEYHEKEAEFVEAFLTFASRFITAMPSCVTEEVPDILEQEMRSLLIQVISEGPVRFTQIHAIATIMLSGHDFGGISEEMLRKVLDEIAHELHSELGATVYELNDNFWHEYEAFAVLGPCQPSTKSYERWLAARKRITGEGSEVLPIHAGLRSNVPEVFKRLRSSFIRSVFPLAAEAFILAKEAIVGRTVLPRHYASGVVLGALELLTLAVHDEVDDEKLWMNDRLIDALNSIADMSPNPPVDHLVLESVRWVITRVSSRMPVFSQAIAERQTPTVKPSKVEGVSSAKKTKRNRAQDRARAAMKAAADKFLESHAFIVEDDDGDSPRAKKTPHSEDLDKLSGTLDESEALPHCCICRGAHRSSPFCMLGHTQPVTGFELPENVGQRRIIAFCGHYAHTTCYFEWRSAANPDRTFSLQIENADRGEFLCPMCKSLCNCIAPYSPQCWPEHWLPSSSEFDQKIEEEQERSDMCNFDRFPSSLALPTSVLGSPDLSSFSVFQAFDNVIHEMCGSFGLSVLSNPSATPQKIRNTLLAVASSVALASQHLASNPINYFGAHDMKMPEECLAVLVIASVLEACRTRSYDVRSQLESLALQLYGLRLIIAVATPFVEEETEFTIATWDYSGVPAPRVLSFHVEGSLDSDALPTLRLLKESICNGEQQISDDCLLRSTKHHMYPFERQCAAIFGALNMDPMYLPSFNKLLRHYAEPILVECAQALKSRGIYANYMPQDGLRPMRPRRFVALPVDHIALLKLLHRTKPCAGCGEQSQHTGVCLICGELVHALHACHATQGSGGCTRHAIDTHHGIGIFHIATAGRVVLINGMRSAYAPAIYIDRNGEDGSSHRSLPLRLDSKRLAFVENIFQTHSISTEIVSIMSRASSHLLPGVY